MANKANEDLCCKLSRKELQSLCKKYGLPANRSHSDLAKLLISYFEKKNFNSIPSAGRFSGIKNASLPTPSIPQLLPGAQFNPAGDAGKDGHGFFCCPRDEDNNSQIVQSNDLAGCFGAKNYEKDGLGGPMYNLQETSHPHTAFQCDGSGLNHKEFSRKSSGKTYLSFAQDGAVDNMAQIKYRNIDVGAYPTENTFTSSMQTFPKVASTSFEFYVRSEEGINLCVDLNSSPSDWTNRVKNEVYVCESMHRNKSRSLHQDLGHFEEMDNQMKNSFLWNRDSGQIKDGHGQPRSSPCSEMTKNDNMEFDQPDKGDGSAIMPCNMAVDVSEHLKIDQVLISSEPNSNTQDQINSGAESCAKDGCTLINDSDVIDTPQIKSACDSVVNSISDGPRSPVTLTYQNSACGNENFENSTLQNSCSLVNPSVVYFGCSASGSMEIPSSEDASFRKDASCSPCENGGFLDLVDSKHNTETEQGRLGNSSELNPDTFGNLLPTCVEEWEKSNIINGMESSECSQIDNPIERTCLSSNDMGSKELRKKRRHIDGEDRSVYGKPDAKILRSSKHIAGEVLPRRSRRLISK